jgi:hypothetical protein
MAHSGDAPKSVRAITKPETESLVCKSFYLPEEGPAATVVEAGVK